MYFVIITLTTIGYGDYCAETMEGRIIVMIAAIWGGVLLSLFVGVVSSIFDVNEKQDKAIERVNISR